MIGPLSAKRWSPAILDHGEGPYWDTITERLLVLDMLRGDVVALSDEGLEVERHHYDSSVALVRRTVAGGLVIAGERELLLIRPDGEREIITIDVPSGCRLNEGGVRPDGSLYIGSLSYDQRAGGGSLWRLAPGPSRDIAVALNRVGISNGLVFDPAGTTAFYVDSHKRAVHSFSVSRDGSLCRGRVFCNLAEVPGVPDGMAIAEDGSLFVAMWGGGVVARISAEGDLLEQISLPVVNVTACAFGGAERATLYVTTSALGLDDSNKGMHGSVFSIDPGVLGAKEPLVRI